MALRQPGETPVVWKKVALPTGAKTLPDRALEATSRARFQAARLTAPRIDPSQVKLNWQPDRRPAPWKTTPQTLLGKAGWRTRSKTPGAPARLPPRLPPRV